MEVRGVPQIDKLDRDILKILSIDCRKSFREIAGELKKAPVTVKKRIDELEKAGIIKGWGVQIDYEKLGYEFLAIIEVVVKKDPNINIQSALIDYPNIFQVYETTGDYDALVLARFKTRNELNDVIKLLSRSKFFDRTNTRIVLNTLKDKPIFNDLMLVDHISPK